eukprot:TRINITY_DN32245_c0_g1_i1.p1 TRINITY_DN32245_c0_g1~~TRINITY_DN32245_c0_g1_i1.p1  ORF type:complete len:177 (-),score=32.69 TRINITY_DN32245_c0_g1_i1:405-935(-)
METRCCCGCTVLDIVKLSFPVVATVTSFAAVIGYSAFRMISPAVFAAICTMICGVLFLDVWWYHRTQTYSQLTDVEQKRPSFVVGKLCLAVVVFFSCLFALIVFQAFPTQVQIFSISSTIWAAFCCLASLVWAIDIFKYHLRLPATAASDTDLPEHASTESDAPVQPAANAGPHEL